MTAFDTYFPFDTGPGANTGVGRWRKMGQLWCDDGVARGVGELFDWKGFDNNGNVVNLGPGGVWANGFYGELGVSPFRWIGVPTPGGDGIIVARLDPAAQQIQLVYRQGVNEGGPIRDPNGWWEVLLYRIAYPFWADYRRVVPVEQETGLPEIPAWVPRGWGVTVNGPDTTVDRGNQEPVISSFTDHHPRWTPGNDYRVRAYATCQRVAGPAVPFGADLRIIRWSDQADYARKAISSSYERSVGNPTLAGWTELPIPSAENCQAVIVSTGSGTNRFEVNSCRIEIDDLGRSS